MTTRIAVRVFVDFAGQGDFDRGAVLLGDLYPVPKGKAHRNLLVPAGIDVDPLEVTVAPGRHVCEVTLPSGGVVTGETVAVDGKTTPLDLDASQSPHESHSWQYLTGNVESQQAYYAEKTPVRKDRTRDFWGTTPVTRGVAVDAEPVPQPSVGWLPRPSPVAASWSALNDLARLPGSELQGALLGELAVDAWTQVEPVDGDEGTALYRFTGDGPTNDPVGGEGDRRFVLVQGGSNIYLVTLPVPWIDVDNFEEMQAEMMVERRPNRTGSPISVTIRDPRLGSGLGYLARGSLDAAGRVFEDVQEMLYEKMANPLAAAAGAYVLVGTDPGRGTPTWHRWVNNLREFKSWLPDGAILYATLQLRKAVTDEQTEQARKAFIEAYDRGVPVYSIGLRWLVDGLSAFPEDAEAATRLAEVRRLAWRVDMRQPFVVLRLNGVR